MESSGSFWGRHSRRSFVKKALVVPFAAPVVVSFTMDSVSAHPSANRVQQHYPNQHHHHHHHPKPVDITKPTISGNPKEGNSLTAHHGKWSHDPTHYRYQWHRHHHGYHHKGGGKAADVGASVATAGTDTRAIYGATGKTYNVSKHDEGHSLTVTVRGVNAGGVGDPATSRPVRVPKPKPASSKPSKGHKRGFTG